MKFTALMMPTTMNTVAKSDRRDEPMVRPKIGKVTSWTPPSAMPPVMRICPASLAIQSSSMMSSMTPRAHMPAAAAITDQGIAVVNRGAM